MEIPIIVRDRQLSKETVDKWRSVWTSICEMCYNNKNIQEEIIVTPGDIQIDEELILNADEIQHTQFFAFRYCLNEEDILLDTVWKEYSRIAGPDNLYKIPEFKRLHVPAYLYYTIGVNSWFRECFPNCKVTFWQI